MMSNRIFKSHNKILLLYYLAFPLKYRNAVITKEIGEGLKDICLEISERYEVCFVEIGYESNHVYFLVQSILSYSVSKMIRMLKSITAKELFTRYPEIKVKLWGGKFGLAGFTKIQLNNTQMRK